jgi:NAD(P)-dependent dehydrogenase (short-subunit alcohol dehydrogenase family)
MPSPFKDDLFAGKVAFVAGGTSGINLGIAARFAELGAKVAILGRNPEKAQAAAEGIGALALTADVRDYAATRAAMERIRDELGPMDIVVSGAAGNFLAPVLGMSANAFKAVVDIDLIGTFNVFRGCHDLLSPSGAALIAITAGQADQAMALQAHACAAKAGINQLVRVLALEWGPDASTQKQHFARIAAKRWGEIGEIAEAAVWLCSDAAAYVTGTIIDVDGGSLVGDASRLDTMKGLA